jgi:carboxysome shell carbonic anhydrase
MFAAARSIGSLSARAQRGRVFPVEPAAWLESVRTRGGVPAEPRLDGRWAEGAAMHPLADSALERTLTERRARVERAFADIEPAIERLAHEAIHERGHGKAFEAIASRWGVDLGSSASGGELPAFHWARPLPWGEVYAHCVLATFAQLARELKSPAGLADVDGEPVEAVVQRFGFHAIDITPCADGRLAGLTEHILRIPPSVITARRSYAGAMFDVDEAIAAFRAVEVERLRQALAAGGTPPDTRFLKIGVYHVSGSQSRHEGCAAHGSDDHRAMTALLERLEALKGAIEALHDTAIAILLVGVDTDDDSIRVHVPDAHGTISIDRFVSSADLRHLTRALPREAAKLLIRDRVAACAGTSADDRATEGMRWLCGYLLKNNIGQIEAVHHTFGGRYPDLGHAERLIVAGDPIDEVQLRNLAFQTQFSTLEEGARDIEVGLSLLGHTHAPRGLAVPVLATARFDARLPGARERAAERARRHAAAIEARHASLPARPLVVRAATVDGEGRIEFVTPPSLRGLEGFVNQGHHA